MDASTSWRSTAATATSYAVSRASRWPKRVYSADRIQSPVGVVVIAERSLKVRSSIREKTAKPMAMVAATAPNMPLTSVTPIAFTLSDGVQTITNLTPIFNVNFSVATGSAGQIRFWMMNVGPGPHGLGPYIFSSGTEDPDNTSDGGSNDEIHQSHGANFGVPGTWTTVGSVADTGSTLSLMTLTLMALGVAVRRFKWAAV